MKLSTNAKAETRLEMKGIDTQRWGNACWMA